MTDLVDEFIAANPDVQWHTRRKIGGHAGVIGTQTDGATVWVIMKGRHHVLVTAPMSHENVQLAVKTLDGIQPGKEFATAADDDIAKIFRASGLPVFMSATGSPTLIKPEGTPT